MGLFDHPHTLPVQNVVLVHGIWADGSSWSSVIERLQKMGANVTAVQLDLASLAGDVTKVRQTLRAQSGPTILVAHSFGGAVITALEADTPNVVGLVYLSAFAPDKGETMKALVNAEPQPPVAAAIRPDAQGFLWLDREGFVQFFAPDVHHNQAQVLAAVQKPIAAGEFMDETPFGEPAWKHLPSWFLITQQDQVVPPPAQHFFSSRAGSTVREVASSHVSMISHPEVVIELIVSAAQAIATAPINDL